MCDASKVTHPSVCCLPSFPTVSANHALDGSHVHVSPPPFHSHLHFARQRPLAPWSSFVASACSCKSPAPTTLWPTAPCGTKALGLPFWQPSKPWSSACVPSPALLLSLPPLPPPPLLQRRRQLAVPTMADTIGGAPPTTTVGLGTLLPHPRSSSDALPRKASWLAPALVGPARPLPP